MRSARPARHLALSWRPCAERERVPDALSFVVHHALLPSDRYWPTVPEKFDGLKACIFDNTEDPQPNDPLFYQTSVQMGK
jgi:hypothetical protein